MALSVSTVFLPTATRPNGNHHQPPPLSHLPTPKPPQNLKLPLLNHHQLITIQHQRPIYVSAISSSQGIGSPGVVPQSIVEALDEVKVLDLEGNAISISDLWKDRKAVVAFARHFGCVLCRKRADYLAAKKLRIMNPLKRVYGRIQQLAELLYEEDKEEMDEAGVALVLIGPGNIDQARAFSQQTKFKGEVYADPDHSSYDALKFLSGVSTIFTPKAGLKIIQVYMEGYRQDWELSLQKHTVERGGWQQGGIIVAGPGKSNISYIHKDKEAGDDPPIEDVLKACCA